MQISTNEKSVIFFFFTFFFNSAQHRQLPDVTELRCSTLAGDGGTESKDGLSWQKFPSCSALTQPCVNQE